MFFSEENPSQCPDCGKEALREATEQEIKEYKHLQEELLKEEW